MLQLLQLGWSCEATSGVTVCPQTCEDGWRAYKKASESDEFPDDGEILG